MEATREIYWNVGHGVMLPMYLLVFMALGAVACCVWQRIRIYRQGRSVERTDHLDERLFEAFKSVLLQLRVVRVKGPGMAHALFFWGFLTLAAGTGLIFLQADLLAPLFGIRFLKGDFYRLFSLGLDLAGLAALLMLAGLFVRRYLVRPEGLETDQDDAVMHGLLFAILLSGFVMEGARMAVTEMGSELAHWSPVGMLVAGALAGLEEPALRTLHGALWWAHLVLTLGFIISIPTTKLRHILTTPANYLFVDRRAKGFLTTLDLEDEEAESFGAAKVADLTWKDIFDADACTECKRCQDRCPAHNTDKPLSPMKMVSQIKEAAFTDPEGSIIDRSGKDALWSCTTCRACQEICPAAVEHVPKVVEMRRNMVLMEGEFPGEEVMGAIDNIEVNGNPLGLAYAARGDWAQDLGIKTLEEDAEVDVLYFVGCYASFDKRNIAVAKSFVNICQAAGVKVGILGKEEKCCGDPARKLGNEYLYQSLALENIGLIESYGIKRIVTTCPHCFNTLAKDYRDLGLGAEVEHYTVFLEGLLRQGGLAMQPTELECTYHDSCYLGRYNDTYEAPRALLQAAGATVTEMERSESESFCCGAGGGRILAEEKLGDRISEKRAMMAAETAMPVLVSNCPFCLTMFEDGIKGTGLDGQLKPRDIAEIIAERLVP